MPPARTYFQLIPIPTSSLALEEVNSGSIHNPFFLCLFNSLAALTTCSLLLEPNYMGVRVFSTKNRPRIRVFSINLGAWGPGVWYWKTLLNHRGFVKNTLTSSRSGRISQGEERGTTWGFLEPSGAFLGPERATPRVEAAARVAKRASRARGSTRPWLSRSSTPARPA